MSTQHIETVIVGGGQAGLATAYHLTRRNRPCLVLDGNARIGENWRQQWDTLRLYTPAKYDGLPGMRFPADSWEFPQKDQVADYLESYATHFELPVRTSTRVDRLEARPGGGYLLAVEGETLTCDNVVVATGTFGRTPNVPAFAADLSPSILQMHSGAYRRPEQLQPGAVLVVGASHSGGDIAFEVAPTHHTILCGPDRGQIPLRIESRKTRVVLPILLFMARHVLTRRTPVGRKMMDEVRFHGGPLLRVKREDLADRGVERLEARVSGVTGGRPALQDGTGPGRLQRGLVHRLQAGLRLGAAADLRRRRLAGGVPGRRFRSARTVLLRAELSVLLRLDDPARDRPRRRIRGPPDFWADEQQRPARPAARLTDAADPRSLLLEA